MGTDDLKKNIELLDLRIEKSIAALPDGNTKFELKLLIDEYKLKTGKLLKEVRKDVRQQGN